MGLALDITADIDVGVNVDNAVDIVVGLGVKPVVGCHGMPWTVRWHTVGYVVCREACCVVPWGFPWRRRRACRGSRSMVCRDMSWQPMGAASALREKRERRPVA